VFDYRIDSAYDHQQRRKSSTRKMLRADPSMMRPSMVSAPEMRIGGGTPPSDPRRAGLTGWVQAGPTRRTEPLAGGPLGEVEGPILAPVFNRGEHGGVLDLETPWSWPGQLRLATGPWAMLTEPGVPWYRPLSTLRRRMPRCRQARWPPARLAGGGCLADPPIAALRLLSESIRKLAADDHRLAFLQPFHTST